MGTFYKSDVIGYSMLICETVKETFSFENYVIELLHTIFSFLILPSRLVASVWMNNRSLWAFVNMIDLSALAPVCLKTNCSKAFYI